MGRIFFLLFIGSVFLPLQLLAQTVTPTVSTTPTPIGHMDFSIYGKVTDALSNDPIPNALVQTDVGGYITTTDFDGYYIISGLSVNFGETVTYTLVAQAEGYYPSVPQLVTATFDGVSGETDFELFPIQTTPTPTSTPNEECLPESLKVSKKRLLLKKGETKEVVVVLEGENCFVEGEPIAVNVTRIGFGRASVSPSSNITDNKGKIIFAITAKKVGRSRITFKAGGLKQSMIVRVVR